MDFHTLSRRELQVLCKRNKIAANMTNVAMADALAALQHVEGLEEFLNPSEPNVAMQSPEKAPPETLVVPRTATRASARAKPTKDPDSSQVVSHARRSTMGSRHAAADQENKQVNFPHTPAMPKTGKRAGLASARRRPEAVKRDEKNEEENRDVPKSSTVQSTQRQARASAVPRVYSTRRSVRLLEKSMSELKVSEERASELEPIKMDDLGSKEELEEVLEEIEENKNALDADSQAAEEESSEKPDHSNVPVEKPTGIEEKERELQSYVKDADSQAAEEESSEKPDHSNVPVEKPTGIQEKERELQSYVKDADSQAAEEESSEKPGHSNVPVEKPTGIEEQEREVQSDVNVNVNVESSCAGALSSKVLLEAECGKSGHSNVPVEKPTGIEEKEREVQSDVNVNVNVESSCAGALSSEVLLEAECGKSDCLSALSDSDLKDDVHDEKSDRLDDNLLGKSSSEKPGHSNVPVEKPTGIEEKEREVQSDVNVNVNVESSCAGALSSKVLLEAECGKSDCLSAFSDSDLKDDVHDEKSDRLGDNLLVSTLNQDAPPVDNQSNDIDVAVKCQTEENGLENPLLPKEQMVENNEGVIISETIICPSDDSDQLVPHITANSDRLVPHCDDILEPVGDNDSGVEISMSSQLEIRDIACVELQESIKLDQLMSPCPVSPIIQTEKHDDEQLVEVDVIESEEFAMEVREWHKSLVETAAAAKSSEVNAPNIQEYAHLQELVDVHVMQEVEFVEGACELPPSAIADKTPIFASKIGTQSPLAVNGKVLSPLTADRLPKSPVLVKSSSKKSTVRKMANKLDNNKENMDIPPSPLAAAADQLQVKSSSKKQSALRKTATLLGDDKENMQKEGRKVQPNTEKAKKKSQEEKITDEDSVLESLQKQSLRQLKKMFKEKLGTAETEREKDATEQQKLGSARPALRVLSENQRALGEVEGN